MTWLSFGPRTEHPGALRVDVLPSHGLVTDMDAWRVCETLERVCRMQAVLA